MGEYEDAVSVPRGRAGILDRRGVAIGTGSSSFDAPDIYEWDFEGATDAIASDDFINGSGNTFIDNTAWVRDTTTVFSGSQSVRQDYAQSVGNVGDAFFYNIASSQSTLYCRFYHRQDASADNDDEWKILRFTENTFAGNPRVVSLIFNLGGANNYGLFFTTLDPLGPRTSTADTPNANRGNWTQLEMHADVTGNPVNAKLWVDGVLLLDEDATGTHNNMQGLQIDGTINSLGNASQAWIDDFALSTTRIGP